MMVNGPLEIYGVVIGVKVFDDIFNILASMGIVFLPLLVMLFKSTTEPYESQLENGASTSLRRVSIQLVTWVFVVMIFVAPTHRLQINEISYIPYCYNAKHQYTATTSRFGDTGTTYDKSLGKFDYGTLRMPIMMGFVLSAMSGLTNAAITSLPCQTDVQKLKNVIDTTNLTPQLSQQVQRFNNECFAPAKAKFTSKPPEKNSYETTMNEYGGQSDLSWMGSHVMQKLYYSGIYPTKPVPEFPYAEPYKGPDAQYNEDNHAPKPDWGYPNCEQWWTDPQYGLEKQLVDLAKNHAPSNSHLGTEPWYKKVENWLARMKNYSHVGQSITADDLVAHNLLYDMGGQNSAGFGRNYGGWMNSDHSSDASETTSYRHGMAGLGGMSTFTHVVSGGAHEVGSFFGGFDRAEIDNEIPIIQAVLLAIALTLGPMIILLGMINGGTGIGVIFTYYFLVGSLFFMTFIERFIRYLEVSIHASQSYGIYAMGNNPVLYNVFTKLYLYAPILYLMLMSIAGFAVGKSVQGSFDNSVVGSGAGAAAGAARSEPAKEAAKGIAKAARFL